MRTTHVLGLCTAFVLIIAGISVSFASEPDTPCFAAGSETPPVEMTILMKGYPLLIHKGINAETLSTVMEVLSHA